MARCQHYDRNRVRCDLEADDCLEAEHASGELEVVDLCRPHKRSFLEDWERMQADATHLRAIGVPEAMLSRIMCARVERHEYG